METSSPNQSSVLGPLDKVEEYFRYLDRLRESGSTNMWCASSYLENRFKLGDKKAGQVLVAWMETFEKDAPVPSRATAAIAKSTGGA